MNFLKSLFCTHDFKFVRNIYGDEIMETGHRSWWECTKCRKWQGRDRLYVPLPPAPEGETK